MAPLALFVGLDIGTGGARAMAVSATGDVVATGQATFELEHQVHQGKWHEQSPHSWWQAAVVALQRMGQHLTELRVAPETLCAIAVDGTSGTVVGVDVDGRETGAGIMYNDGRAVKQAERLNLLASRFCNKVGYQFAPSFALAKILWLAENAPQQFHTARYFIHQADFITSRLTGVPAVSDYSNALKTGYDLVDDRWPTWINELSDVREKLPRVVAPGTRIGEIHGPAAAACHLPEGLPVIAGATDGTAGFLASGANQPGDDSTTLGTTLVFKRLSKTPAHDTQGQVYSHKLPGGLWLPGAASNTGSQWIRTGYTDCDLEQLSAQALQYLPSEILCYPLTTQGERFPFCCDRAAEFCEPATNHSVQRFAASLQGTAFIERLAYEALDQVACETTSKRCDIFATGGGSQNDHWLQLRADITGRIVHRPACPESAFGSAILAAAGAGVGDVWQASRQMVHIEKTMVPDPSRKDQYDTYYERFKSLLHAKGYLRNSPASDVGTPL